MLKPILLGTMIIVIAGATFLFLRNTEDVPSTTLYNPSENQNTTGVVDGKVPDITEPDNSQTLYNGKILSNSLSPYIEFNQLDYENALNSDKLIYLEFYADWCPICRAQEPQIISGMQMLDDPNIIGFRVNYKDDQTDEDEKSLAEAFNVKYQHTKVVLKNGKPVYNILEVWNKNKLISTLKE